MMPKNRCPTPQKVDHDTKASAKRHLNSLWASGGKAGAAYQHVYKCPCGKWHVGGRRKSRGRKRVQR